MLTDIFAHRYADIAIWQQVTDRESRLLVQTFRLLNEQLCPYYWDGKESVVGKSFWSDLQSRMSMELGLKSLSPTAYAFQSTLNGKPFTQTGTWTMLQVCETWMLAPFDASSDEPNRFVMERLSLVELAFRKRGEEITDENQSLDARIADAKDRLKGAGGGFRLPGNAVEGMKAANKTFNERFKANVDELNARLRQAGCGLHYHNGFIQRAVDNSTTDQVEAPFWSVVAGAKWANVDRDMKEAVDLRDSGGRDPAFYAARALESTIKIISGAKGWTHGREKGAHNFIENLASKNNAFVADWEADLLKLFFTKVRNPFGHGPGDGPMPSLSPEQTDWAIEAAMSWIKALVRRSGV